MNNLIRNSKIIALYLFIAVCTPILVCAAAIKETSSSTSASNLYWIGGSGNWDDGSHWSELSGGLAAGYIPDANTCAIFNNNSGLSASDTIKILAGNWSVLDFRVNTQAAFNLLMDGSDTNGSANMNIYGDLRLRAGHSLTYSDSTIYYNQWTFTGSGAHELTPVGKDLLNVEFLDEDGTYNQMSNLIASEQIRMYGGTWNTNNYNVNSGYLYFRDSESSSNPLDKLFNAGTSNIQCDEFNSKLTYGSLTTTGTYTIYTKIFHGSPKQNFGPAFSYHNIHLQEQEDGLFPGQAGIIESNNFECTACIINKIEVDDTSITQFAGEFVVGDLIINNIGSQILFNGGNSRADELTINGTITTPSTTLCDEKTTFSNVYNSFTTIIRASGTLSISDAIINNIHTSGGATFDYQNSTLTGSSTGWIEGPPPSPLSYRWIGNNTTTSGWDDPANWRLTDGTDTGCYPSIIDNVFVDGNSLGSISIPSGVEAFCNNFTWTNTNNLTLSLDGIALIQSKLTVGGDFTLNSNATIIGNANHDLEFVSTTENTITSAGNSLPNIRFNSADAIWDLNDDLICEKLVVAAGTLHTNNHDITADDFNCVSNDVKVLELGSSHIVINGSFNPAVSTSAQVTVDAGTSLIECEAIYSFVPELYDVKINNVAPLTLADAKQSYNRLIINSNQAVTTENDLTVNILNFAVNGSKLIIDADRSLTVTDKINSLTSASNPASILSNTNGNTVELNNPNGNICASGHISFKDINASGNGVFHAPDGINNGNNTAINFNANSGPYLYWRAGSGDWQVQSNWSRISGGCPAGTAPSTSPRLIFDNHSFFLNNRTIDIPFDAVANDIYFYSSPYQGQIQLPFSLSPDNLFIDSGNILFTGRNLLVQGVTEIKNNGTLETDLLLISSPVINLMSNGMLNMRENSTVQIEE